MALLADAYWRNQLASAPAIVGKAIDLNGTPVTIVGVLPATFDFGAVFSPGAKVDLFTPLDLVKEHDWGNIVTLFGRLKPGVTVAQALDDAQRVAPSMYFNIKYPDTLGRYKGSLIPVTLKDYVTGKLRRSLIALWVRGGHNSAHRWREPFQSASGSRAAALCQGICRPWRSRGEPRTNRPTVADGGLVLSGIGAAFGLGLALMLIAWLAHEDLSLCRCSALCASMAKRSLGPFLSLSSPL